MMGPITNLLYTKWNHMIGNHSEVLLIPGEEFFLAAVFLDPEKAYCMEDWFSL